MLQAVPAEQEIHGFVSIGEEIHVRTHKISVTFFCTDADVILAERDAARRGESTGAHEIQEVTRPAAKITDLGSLGQLQGIYESRDHIFSYGAMEGAMTFRIHSAEHMVIIKLQFELVVHQISDSSGQSLAKEGEST